MLSPTEIQEQLNLLQTHRATLSHLLMQAAVFGGELLSPPQTMHGILDARQSIQRIKTTLRDSGTEVEDRPEDSEEEYRKLPYSPERKREKQVVDNLISFLEDRRILFNHHTYEVPSYTVRSVLFIREYLNKQLSKVDRSSVIADSMRKMQSYCRDFLTEMERNGHIINEEHLPRPPFPKSDKWLELLDRLRIQLLPEVKRISQEYKVEVTGELHNTLRREK